MTALQNFNISVAVTERFMQAVERGEAYDLDQPAHAQGRPARRDARDGLPPARRERLEERRSRASSSSTASTATTRRRSWAASRRRTRAASSRCCRTSPATSARSISRGSCAQEPRADDARAQRQARDARDALRARLGCARRGDPALRALPRRRDRAEPLPDPADRRDDEADAQDRARRHGLGRPALRAAHPLRLRRGDRAGGAGDVVHPGARRPRVGGAGGRARRLPGVARVDLRPGVGRQPRRAALPQLDAHDGRADRHAQHHRRLLRRHRARVRAGVHAPALPRPQGPDEGDAAARGEPDVPRAWPSAKASTATSWSRISPRAARSPSATTCRTWAKDVFRTSHDIAPGVARADAGGVPAPHRQRRQQDDQLPQRRDGRRTSSARTCWRIAKAARASRCTATARATSRCSRTRRRAGPEQAEAVAAEIALGVARADRHRRRIPRRWHRRRRGRRARRTGATCRTSGSRSRTSSASASRRAT